jgi:hypothetical protein
MTATRWCGPTGPWQWWGLEPLDQRRPDWETRYSAVFRVATDS